MRAFNPGMRKLLTAVAAALLPGCRTLPSLAGRTHSVTLEHTADTRLGRAVLPLARAHPGTSGVVPLADGRDAFAARVLLADAAERTLDVQYYIWHDDMSGTLLFDALRRAADRGVRVRLLLDDNNTARARRHCSPRSTRTRTSRCGCSIRSRSRSWRALGYLTDFARLNRRMHNKSFTADNQATIIGGRNVGDEYFGAGDGRCCSSISTCSRSARS